MAEGVAPDEGRNLLRALYRAPEEQALAPLIPLASFPPAQTQAIAARARDLVRAARKAHKPGSDVSDFLKEYGLGTPEGVALLCLAEALLRIPDAATADALIEDRIAGGDWESHLGRADSLAVNASSWAFLLTGRVLSRDETRRLPQAVGRMVRRVGEPVIRAALRQGMRVLARQFVMGRTIEEALTRAGGGRWRLSFDMLGEAAITRADADRYLIAYRHAIGAIGRHGGGPGSGGEGGMAARPGISVKLSALSPRFTPLQAKTAVPELIAALGDLARAARAADIGLTMDAEEAARLELSLDVFAAVLADPRLAGWNGLGLAVQAYQKRALPVIEWIASLARRTRHRIPLRLVKGAYWDSEIKAAQIEGLADYPVYTRKAATDIAWIGCARRMLALKDAVFPAFATHNAQSLATVLTIAEGHEFEMQRLHGMGEALYESVNGKLDAPRSCPVRVYAPVGTHEDLLAYLVRRLLENGANTSFVHRLLDPAVPEDAITADPLAQFQVAQFQVRPGRNPRLPLPPDLYPDRRNSAGFDFSDGAAVAALAADLAAAGTRPRLVAGGGEARDIRAPADRRILVGRAHDAAPVEIAAALATLSRAARGWDEQGGMARAGILERAADLIEAARADLLFLLAREAGRTLVDGHAEIREAADFCRYYASLARRHFSGPSELPGPTGERNTWELRGRGVFAAISPWNFPLSIFAGQIAAALAAGNAVAAKPAEQTPLIAGHAVDLLYQAGVPREALRLLPGDGRVGQALVAAPQIDGVVFTGGSDTAAAIAATLAARPGPILPFIAETGGINAMIADSSALPEQVVADALASAFGSAGQRCSALRLLCLQDDTADRILVLLKGAAETLTIGDPLDAATDIGPVIEPEACARLAAHAKALGAPLFECALPPAARHGSFFAPRAFLLADPTALREEVFGPILHIVRYPADRLEDLLAAIAGNGFGLTLAVHSRIEAVQRRIVTRLGVGNAYVNRNQIGAVVGVQPFGGHGRSGTGPKAGGPLALFRFAKECAVSVNTAAAGGNAALLAAEEG